MKRYFVKTNAFNCVVFADGNGKGYLFGEMSFDDPLTLEVAKRADYSNADGCETVEEISACAYGERGIIDFNPNDPDFEEVVEF